MIYKIMKEIAERLELDKYDSFPKKIFPQAKVFARYNLHRSFLFIYL